MFTAVSVRAEIYRVPMSPNLSLETIQQTVREDLPNQLSPASCGWVHADTSVGDTPGQGYIADVQGLPGRSGEPLGLKESGMAKSGTDFQFPGNTWGLTTSCPASMPGEEPQHATWYLWRDPGWDEAWDTCRRVGELPQGDLSSGDYVEYDCTMPPLGDAACTTTPENEGVRSPGICNETCWWMNQFMMPDCREFAYYDIEVYPEDFWRLEARAEPKVAKPRLFAQLLGAPDDIESSGGWAEFSTPDDTPSDGNFLWPVDIPPIDPNNPFLQPFEIDPGNPAIIPFEPEPEPPFEFEPFPEPEPEPEPEPIIITVQRCAQERWGWRYFCTGDWADDDPETEDFSNCKVCTGEECRCPGPGCVHSKTPPPAGGGDPVEIIPEEELPAYVSFYREYFGSTERYTFDETPDDQLDVIGNRDLCNDTNADLGDRERECITAACYGIYDPSEPDWHDTAMTLGDQRCVLKFPLDMTSSSLRWSQGGQTERLEQDSADEIFDRSRSSDENPWEPVLDTLSFLDPNASNGLLSFSEAILTPSTSEVRVPGSIDELFAGNENRATDDTVDPRTGEARFFVRWLQGLFTNIQDILRMPTIHVRVPALWERFLPPSARAQITLPQVGSQESRILPIDLQLRAGPGLTTALADVFRQILTIKQEEIALAIPANSCIDFKNRALEWERYRQERQQLKLDVPEAVDDLISKLHEYCAMSDRVRALRAQVPLFLTMIVERQGEAIDRINNWVEANADRYREILEADNARLELSGLAREIAQEAERFGDEVNMPWCRSDRFTDPLPWLNSYIPGWPDNKGTGSCDPNDNALPLVCPPQNQRDRVYDLSTLKVDPGALTVPTFTVTPVFLKLPPAPTDPNVEIRNPDDIRLPDPSDIAAINWSERLAPAFEMLGEEPPLPPLPEPFDPEIARPAMEKALQILRDRNAVYEAFWKSFEPNDDVRELRCDGPGQGSCKHTEQSLLETVRRAVARPGAVLKEDLEIRGAPRYPVGTPETRWDIQRDWSISCNPADHSCAPLLPEYTESPDGWQILRGPDDRGDTAFDELRRDLRKDTIDDDGTYARDGNGKPRAYGPSPEAIYPIFDRARDSTLLPDNL